MKVPMAWQEDDEKWSWGYATDLKPIVNVNTKLHNRLQRNPCDPVKLPDFRMPGRRISHTKCLEYIWDIKDREDKVIRDEECKKYRQSLNNNTEDNQVFHTAGVGGRDTLPGEFPHMGAIGWTSALGSWIFKCGGSLISTKFVLTAGHCSKASDRDTTIADVDPKIVRFADKNILDIDDNGYNKAHLDVNILRVINHPNYKPPKKYNDIALIELQREVSFTSYVQPACLYTGSDKELYAPSTPPTSPLTPSTPPASPLTPSISPAIPLTTSTPRTSPFTPSTPPASPLTTSTPPTSPHTSSTSPAYPLSASP
ncbi:unnamed protein product [Diatraea saccharalis]|uniref:Peptidase S1 domain-containing protein n=1 Tax=Diatraea saccharalis TaxID=40085 RepID=A0A9N9WGP3_9NEOP|nr:unnamed protein product [Diatraea saccharalis]